MNEKNDFEKDFFKPMYICLWKDDGNLETLKLAERSLKISFG